MEDNESDRTLVRRCMAGEAKAHQEFLDRHKDRVFSLLLRLLRNSADAEDVAQETFLKAFRSLKSYDPSFPLMTWLFKIAHNSALDFLRIRKPEAISLHDEDHPLDMPEESPTPEQAAEASSENDRLERLLAALPELYREVLILRHREDMNYRQIAEVLRLPEGTVKIRLFRARDALRKKLEALEKV